MKLTPIHYDESTRHLHFCCLVCQSTYHFHSGVTPVHRQLLSSRCVQCGHVYTGEILRDGEIIRAKKESG